MLVNDWKNATNEESIEALRQLREAAALDDNAWEDETIDETNAAIDASLEELRWINEIGSSDDDGWEDELDELLMSGRGSDWRIKCPSVDKLGYEAN